MLTGYVGEIKAAQVPRRWDDGLINIELENGVKWFGVNPSILKNEPDLRHQLNKAKYSETHDSEAHDEAGEESGVSVVEFPIIEEPRPSESSTITAKEKPVKERRFHEPVPRTINAQLLQFFSVNKGDLNIRIHWGELVDSKARDYFRRNGLEQATSNIRPLKNKQYAISGTVDFSLPPAYLMKHIGVSYKEENGRVVIHNVEYALGLVLLGFEPNKSAKW